MDYCASIRLNTYFTTTSTLSVDFKQIGRAGVLSLRARVILRLCGQQEAEIPMWERPPSVSAPNGAHLPHLPALNGLRLLAFLLVFVHHMPAPESFSIILGKINSLGWAGVDIFLVISSFLIFHLFILEWDKTRSIDVGSFYIRRLLRLYPLMLAFPILMLCIYPATLSAMLRVVGLALLSDNLIAWFKGYNDIEFSAHLWTLSFEFQAYLLMPFAYLAFRRFAFERFVIGMALVYLFCFALRIVFTTLGAPHPIVWATPFLRPDSFFFGFCLAVGVFNRVPLWASAIALLAAVVVISASPLPWASVVGSALVYPAVAIAGLTAVMLALRSAIVGGILSWGPVAYLGKISFGLYVFHVWAIKLSADVLNSFGPNIEPAPEI